MIGVLRKRAHVLGLSAFAVTIGSPSGRLGLRIIGEGGGFG
jgi:hypothetical protein